MNKYGEILIQAVQDTLETMAFAEVIPYAMQIGEDDYHRLSGHCPSAPLPLTSVSGVSDSGWGSSDASDSGWGSNDAPSPLPAADATDADPWGAPAPSAAVTDDDDAWGNVASTPTSSLTVPDWGGKTELPPQDSWGEPSLLAPVDEFAIPALDPRVVNFDEMVREKTDWCRACMRVNSPDVHSVWFIVSQDLAVTLASNMYGDAVDVAIGSPLIRDLVAEITNILGGRMMLLLERLGGKFTLTVPELDFEPPVFDADEVARMVTCHVLVDGMYPVISSIVFNGEIQGNLAGA